LAGVREQNGRRVVEVGEVKINIPGAAKSRLSRAVFFQLVPPKLLSTPIPPPLNPSPKHYKTFNLDVELKRNGFSSIPRE
jgi:hypothetical protein